MGIKITPADTAFSLCVRERSGWVCQRCKRQYEYKAQGLHCSHYFGRRSHSTRFSELNCFAHCHGCHQYLSSHPDYFYQHYIEEYGETALEILRERHNDLNLGRLVKRNLSDVAKHYREQHKIQLEKRADGVTGWLEFVDY